MSESDEIPYRYAYTVAEGTGSALARAWVAWSLRQRSTILTYGVLWVMFFVLTLLSSTVVTAGAVVFAVLVGVVPVVVCHTLAYVRSRRGLTRLIRPGSELRSGFGDRALVATGSYGSTRINYSAIKSIAAQGPAVLVRISGSPIVNIWPRELFPDHEVERIQRAIATAARWR